MLRQDDPAKCTAAKLAKFQLVEPVRHSNRSSIVLDPFANIVLSASDRDLADAVCAIDCSWERIEESKKMMRFSSAGTHRRLPAMLAANPINYAKMNKLSSAEALAGALYILGDQDTARKMMDKFKWGHTFLELNANLLMDYAIAQTKEQIHALELEYFPTLPH